MTKEQLREFEKDLVKTGLENVQNIILVKNGATNGDVIKGVFPDEEIYKGGFGYDLGDVCTIDFDWWNALYER